MNVASLLLSLLFLPAACAYSTLGTAQLEYRPGGRVTPTAVRLPDGRVVPLVDGGAQQPRLTARVHSHDGSVTVVEPGRVWHVRRDGTVANMSVSAAAAAGAGETVCAVAVEVAAELVAALGLATAAAHADELVGQADAVFRHNGAPAGVVLHGDVTASAVGVYATPSTTLAALRDTTANPACARYLFSERAVYDGATRVLGNAYEGGGCSATYGYGCVYSTLDTLVVLAVLVHELGHTMGAGHDTASGPNANLMYPTINAGESLVLTAASVAELEAWYATATCVTARPHGSSDPDTVAIAVGTSVGAVALAAIVGGAVAYSRRAK